MVGVATGLAMVELFNPVAGAQEYVVPPLAVSVTLFPGQIPAEAGTTVAVAAGLTVITDVVVPVHPDAFVTTTV